jgi:hypothetical protein
VSAPEHSNLAGAIYGTILATSVVAGLSESGQVGKAPAAAVVLGTSVVFWIAHVYAGVLGLHLERRRGLSFELVRGVMTHEWPILVSGVPPAVVLALGSLGFYDRATGYAIAIGVGVLSLVLWGVAYAREQGYGLVGILVAGGLNGLLGVVIVGLKVLVH